MKKQKKKYKSGSKRLKPAKKIDWFEVSECWINDCKNDALPGLAYCQHHAPLETLVAMTKVAKNVE